MRFPIKKICEKQAVKHYQMKFSHLPDNIKNNIIKRAEWIYERNNSVTIKDFMKGGYYGK